MRYLAQVAFLRSTLGDKMDTQAGDDSEGKMWGLEGTNILIAVGGFVVGVSVTVLSFLISSTPPVTALCYGIVPAVLGLVYVFTLREGRPRSYDRDLFDTFMSGRSWQSKPLRTPHPLFLPLIIFCLFFSGALQAQFIPSQYTDRMPAKSNTGSGLQTAGFGKMIKGPMKAGTKLRLKGVEEAPGDPTARLFALSAGAVNYDAAVLGGGAFYQFMNKHAALHEQYESEEMPWERQMVGLQRIS